MVSILDVTSVGAILSFRAYGCQKRSTTYRANKGFKIAFIPILVPPSILASKRAERFIWMLFINVKR
jgi:hypothetical protein